MMRCHFAWVCMYVYPQLAQCNSMFVYVYLQRLCNTIFIYFIYFFPTSTYIHSRVSDKSISQIHEQYSIVRKYMITMMFQILDSEMAKSRESGVEGNLR